MNFLKHLFLFFCVVFLAACGGGSSNSGDSASNSGVTNNPAGNWLTFDPSQIETSAYEGESVAVNVIGTATKTFTKTANIAIVDTVGVLTTNTSIAAISQMQYRVTLNSNPSLKPGVYSSNIQVRVCEDDPRVCNTPFPGSPWTLPYKITIKSNASASQRLTVSPASVDLVGTEGDSLPIKITAKASADLPSTYNIAIIDRGTATYSSSNFGFQNKPNQEFSVDFMVKNTLLPGSYSGQFEVRVCADDPNYCNKPLAGSPWQVPYKITLKSKAAGTTITVSSVPSVLDLTYYEGEQKQFTISAESLVDSGKAMNIGVYDSAHNSTLKSTSQQSSKKTVATFETSPALKAGVYTSTLDVRVCADDPIQCQWPYNGSPYQIPLKITVRPNTNLTTLKVLPQVGSWSTFQGNASHTAYVPATFYSSNFSRRWSWSSSGGYLSDVSIENGSVFLNKTTAVYPSGGYELIALSENSGQALWRTSMGVLSKANSPAVGSSKVFITSTGHDDTFFWVFDQVNGSLLNKVAMSSQWETYLAPTVYGNEVFTESGYYGGMSKYGISEQKIVWGIGLPQYDGWSPAVDANFAYTYLSGSLHAVSKIDGKLAYTIKNPDFSWAGYGGGTPVLSEKNMAYLVGNGLQAFDLTKQTRPWSVTGTIYGSPAYAKDVVYVLNANGTVLEARSALNGNLLWMASAMASDKISRIYKYVVVTDNLAFISSTNTTLAIDLNTHKVVWEHPFGGSLAISDRAVLYIRGEGRLDAINLQ
ncbi:MAG: PQQ-binding-like beta-propeller repeat protein [Burkholderiales bacterium]|nr:PQQ-binding-like beta-propeller repeat protein [Burkholderiales bacterium]